MKEAIGRGSATEPGWGANTGTCHHANGDTFRWKGGKLITICMIGVTGEAIACPPGPLAIDENGRVKRIDADLRTVFAVERLRMISQIDSLQQRFGDIVASSELTSTDDEHDPEGATIAYERAQVSALLRQARLDLVALDEAAVLIDDGTVSLCSACGGPIVIERLLALPGVRICINCAR